MHIAAKTKAGFSSVPKPGLTDRPWWKEPYVWMVIAGPLSAVIACAITAVYILRGPDAVVSEDYYREGIALGQEVQKAQPPMQPAQMGRNHSVTGGRLNASP
jgi:hypothetical protein